MAAPWWPLFAGHSFEENYDMKSYHPEVSTWHAKVALALAAGALLAGCGGGADSTVAPNAPQGATLALSAAAPASAEAYVTAVHEIYLAYLGRPADAGGLANFTAYLAAIGAPTDLAGLANAYGVNPQVRAVIDTFANSPESVALYGKGSSAAFVNAVYLNLLNRNPDLGGLEFWALAIEHGVISRSLASLSIAAAAMGNTSSDQGRTDAQTLAAKASAAAYFSTALKLAPAGTYDGEPSAFEARVLMSMVTASTDLAAFQKIVDTKGGTVITGPVSPH
jgi:S-layer protein